MSKLSCQNYIVENNWPKYVCLPCNVKDHRENSSHSWSATQAFFGNPGFEGTFANGSEYKKSQFEDWLSRTKSLWSGEYDETESVCLIEREKMNRKKFQILDFKQIVIQLFDSFYMSTWPCFY